MRHLLRLLDVSASDVSSLLADAARLKADAVKGVRPPLLAGRVLGMVFEKPSLRTRASFEAGMAQLGGSSVFLSAADGSMGKRETVEDFARTLSGYCDLIALRVFKQETLEKFAAVSKVPVINALSDMYHPCQALGDLLTAREAFGSLEGRTLVFVGDGNNVARSVAIGCGLVGMKFILAAPEGYAFDADYLAEMKKAAPKAEFVHERDPIRAVKAADVIYTDVWTSMGQEEEKASRLRSFAPYQVNERLMAAAPNTARLMHCLPAIRGEEIDHVVLDGPQSIVFEQAENRMHAQKALMVWLLGK